MFAKRMLLLFCLILAIALVSAAGALAASPPQAFPKVEPAGLHLPATIQVPHNVRDFSVHISCGGCAAGIQQAEQQRVANAAKFLVTREFSPALGRSHAVTPRVTITGKTGNRLHAEALYVFLDKQVWSATLSKIEYDVVADQVVVKRKIDNFSPVITAVQTPARVSNSLVTAKVNILKNVKLVPLGYGPKALANTPASDIPPAVTWTNIIHNIFVQAFGSGAEKKIGNQSTKAALLDVLQKGTNLVAWNNIGHGNPNLLVQWNGETLWSGDFNTTVPFQGIYNAVILLNSCNTCAAPYSLKNSIMRHNPRTYIAGSKNLPIGRSEEVDKIFWEETLLQNKPMAVAINDGQARKGLQGYFCLTGYNGLFSAVSK